VLDLVRQSILADTYRLGLGKNNLTILYYS